MSLQETEQTGHAPFKAFLFWYVTLQCALSVAAAAASFGFIFVTLRFELIGEATIDEGLARFEKVEKIVGGAIGIVLAISVARRLGTAFGPALGGFFLGNIISLIIMAPLLYGTDPIVANYGYPIGVLIVVGMMVAYALAVTGTIVIGRRRSARQRRLQSLIEPFT